MLSSEGIEDSMIKEIQHHSRECMQTLPDTELARLLLFLIFSPFNQEVVYFQGLPQMYPAHSVQGSGI